MISYPSDAEEEQHIVRNCVNKWNDIHSNCNSGIVLLPVDHKRNMPSLLANHEEERTQDVINKYIVEPSDWLIAVFKNKFGTSTGKAESGTVEEIELFKKAKPGNPVSVYFYRDTVDEQVKRYRDRLEGYRHIYSDCAELQQFCFDDLSLMIHKNTFFQQRIQSDNGFEERYRFLLRQVLKDPGKMIMISTVGKEVIIETAGSKHFGLSVELNYLCRKHWLEQQGGKGEVFTLTPIGQQEAIKLEVADL